LLEALASFPSGNAFGTSTNFVSDVTAGAISPALTGYDDALHYNGSAASISNSIAGPGGSWVILAVSIPVAVPITFLSRQPSQQFYPLPDYNYAWWQEHAQRPQAAWYIPPAPPTRQPS